jgi:hypothetical protein
MITDEIEESIKKKQIIIKRMRFKLITKNKLEDTFIFWQREREKREKREEKKKNTLEPNRCTTIHTHQTIEKTTLICFQHYCGRQCLTIR